MISDEDRHAFNVIKNSLTNRLLQSYVVVCVNFDDIEGDKIKQGNFCMLILNTSSVLKQIICTHFVSK